MPRNSSGPFSAKEVKTLLAEAQRTGSLSLHERGLTVIPGWVHELTELKVLNVGNNKLTNIDNLALPQSLEELHLYNNAIPSVERLVFPDSLTTLDLQGNRLTTLHGVHLPAGLEILHLGANHLSDFRSLSLPSALWALYLMENHFSSVTGLILPSGLRCLYIGTNPIADIRSIVLPDDLSVLDLSGIPLGSVDGMRLPAGLTELELYATELRSLRGIQDLHDLKRLDVRENPELRLPWDVAAAVDNPSRILAWQFEADEMLREVKVALLGEAETGKTALCGRLCRDNRSDPSKRTISFDASTLELRDVEARVDGKCGSTDFMWLSVLDFGGQRHLRSAHKVFLSNRRTVYIIVLDATRDLEANRAEYWLEYVQNVHEQWLRREVAQQMTELNALGKWTESEYARRFGEVLDELRARRSKPPVVIILTHCATTDESPSGQGSCADGLSPRRALHRRLRLDDVVRLAERHSAQVVDGFDSYAKEGLAKLDDIAAAIERAVAAMPEVWQELYPMSFGEVMEAVRERFGGRWEDDREAQTQAWMMSEREALELIANACPSWSPDHAIPPDQYLASMRNLGVVHWLGDWPAVDDELVKRTVFNPRAVRWPVYDVLWMDDAQRGVVSQERLLSIIEGRDSGHDQDQRRARRPIPSREQALLILKLMVACDLVIRLASPSMKGTWYLVPDLLPLHEPVHNANQAAVTWSLGFLDDALLPRLISDLWELRDPNVAASRHSVALAPVGGGTATLVAFPREGELKLYAPNVKAAPLQRLVGAIEVAMRSLLGRTVHGELRQCDRTEMVSTPMAAAPPGKASVANVEELLLSKVERILTELSSLGRTMLAKERVTSDDSKRYDQLCEALGTRKSGDLDGNERDVLWLLIRDSARGDLRSNYSQRFYYRFFRCLALAGGNTEAPDPGRLGPLLETQLEMAMRVWPILIEGDQPARDLSPPQPPVSRRNVPVTTAIQKEAKRYQTAHHKYALALKIVDQENVGRPIDVRSAEKRKKKK